MKPKETFMSAIYRSFRGSKPNPGPFKPLDPKAKYQEVIEIQPHVEPIYKITGTVNSYKKTLTSLSGREDSIWANVHTAEDEGCSWVLLLDALQKQERTSREWDSKGSDPTKVDHTICYLIQRKKRCWDYMPLNATKPFATTTICHLVEIMAMLGLVWTEFDFKDSNLAAEGNGYMVKSEYLQGLGILCKFSRIYKPIHKGNRIIPCNEIKKLCFGEVPSLFDDTQQKLLVGPGRLAGWLTHVLPDLADHHERFLKPDQSSKLPQITRGAPSSPLRPSHGFLLLPC
jgi:hypothetical protein